MSAARLLTRVELRRRWRSLVGVGLLVAFAGGATLAGFAGARRTESAFDRFVATSRTQDVLVLDDHVTPAVVRTVRRLPGVAAVGQARFLALTRPNGQSLSTNLSTAGAVDDVVFRDVYRPRFIHGRAPRPDAPDEVVIGEPMARVAHLHVGDTLPVAGLTQEQVDELRTGGIDFGAALSPAGPVVRLRIVGISRVPSDLSLQGLGGGTFLLPRAFVERYGARIGNWYGARGGILAVRLTDGADGIPGFVPRLRRVLDDHSFELDPTALSIGGVQESIDLLALGVLLFGAIAGVAGMIAVGLTASRQVGLIALDQAPVGDLGMTRPERGAAAAMPVLVAVVLGARVAMIAAWVVSPSTPFGVAGDAEPDPGMHFDLLVLGVGALAIAVIAAAIVGVAAWRAARRTDRSMQVRLRPSAVTRTLDTIGMAPPATVGIRMALEPGRGRTAAPVRSALTGAVVAVLGVIAVVVFSGSLDHLVRSPTDYGLPWDVTVSDTGARPERSALRCGSATTGLVADRAIEAIANACGASLTIQGHAVGAISVTPLRGTMVPTALAGRAPRGPDEVALGTNTMRTLHGQIGDRIVIRQSGRRTPFRVVGRVIVPRLVEPQAIADGALFTGAGFDRLGAPESEDTDYTLVVRFRPDVDTAAAAARIERMPGVGVLGRPGVRAVPVPLEVQRVDELDRIPDVLAAFLAVLGAIAVGHLLVTSVRRRRRDLAVLKALGFERTQLFATVASQATTVAVFGVAVGLVAGIVAGAGIWRLTADHVGVLPHVDVPVLAVLAVVAVTVLIANAVAIFPARTAASLPAATVLRAE